MLRKSTALLVASLLTGCATSKTTYLPDGSVGHSIVCSGSALSWAQCEQKAGAICKSEGYTVISRDEDTGASISGTQFGLFGGTTHNRSMLVKCNGETPAAPPHQVPKRKPGNPAMN
jgi:hypothetical protein